MYIQANHDVTLNNLIITNGNSTAYGAGVFVNYNSTLTGDNLEIYNNTSSGYGGGVSLYGARAILTNTNIHNNTALGGRGCMRTIPTVTLLLLTCTRMQTCMTMPQLPDTGYGGGLFVRQGTVNVTDCSDLYSNDAIFGGGAYLITSTLTLVGSCSEIQSNTATGDGGGVYAIASTISLDDEAELYNNNAGVDSSGSGGGAYLNGSSLYSAKALVQYNGAADYGGGIYAGNGSLISFSLGSFTCVGTRCSRLSNNLATNQYGGGVYASNSDVNLVNTYVESNSAYLGGGVYASGADSQVSLSGSLFARNNATGGTGDGLRLHNSASLSGSGNTLAYNEAGGAATGRAIDLYSASGSLSCSVIWGHANTGFSGMNITYSDVQYGLSGAGNINQNPLFVAPSQRGLPPAICQPGDRSLPERINLGL